MIHDLVLPPWTEKCLRSIVELQMTLLEYAASKEFNTEGYAGYRNYLRNHSTYFKGYEEQVARQVWEGPKKVQLLKDFSTSFYIANEKCLKEYNDPAFKSAWLTRIRREIECLEPSGEKQLKIYYFYGNGIKYIQPPHTQKKNRVPKSNEMVPLWQQKAGEFFLHFYTMYLESSNQSFPAEFFPHDTLSKFGKQDLLNAFRTYNRALRVCPACDENGYFTISKVNIHATLDHYLPKDIYPHFACHPHNIVPTCYPCNSTIKGIRDPLHKNIGEDGPSYLHRYAMPYTFFNRKENVYLKVDLSQGIRSIRIVGLQPAQKLQDIDESGLYSALEVLQRIYDIPGRWSEEEKKHKNVEESERNHKNSEEKAKEEIDFGVEADKVSEALFRRMRQFLGQGKDFTSGSHMGDELYNVLSLLLYYLSEEDRYRDPLTVPMLWILAALLTQENQQLQTISERKKEANRDKEYSPLPAALNEVLSWCGQNAVEMKSREEKVQEILKVVRQRREFPQINTGME